MDIIDFLYSTVGIVVAIGYMPQSIRLLRTAGPCDDISILAWAIWGYAAAISLLYSIYILADLKLSMVNGINVFFISFIIAVTFYKRRKYADQVFMHVPEEDVLDLENVPEVKNLDPDKTDT